MFEQIPRSVIISTEKKKRASITWVFSRSGDDFKQDIDPGCW